MKHHFLLFVAIIFFIPFPLQGATDEILNDFSHSDILTLGEKMYRQGMLPSGKPMKAYVMGDIPVNGRMFACVDCHQRSGLGSEEGTVITWPTNGKELFRERLRTGAFRPPKDGNEKQNARRQLPKYYQMEAVRPPYSDKTLARVLRTGIDSSGRRLDPIMPKYRFGKINMAIMIYYLKHLSVDLSPGVNQTTLHFATVIDQRVNSEKTMAMLAVLQAHIDAHNSQSRHEEKRAASGPFYKSERHKAYRRLQLHQWKVAGPEETWPGQLKDYYSKQPVFALLGGITAGSWESIHHFSEEHKIPCIFPITDQPHISDSDWYTLYFSKGLFQEGESTAKYLRSTIKDYKKTRVVQIQRSNNEKSNLLSQGFSQTWAKIGGEPPVTLALDETIELTRSKWREILDRHQPEVIIAWLDKSEKTAYDNLAENGNGQFIVMVSSTLIDYDFSTLPDKLQDNLKITHPYSLHYNETRSRFSVKRWLEARKIPINHFEIQAKMYFLGWMLPGAIKNIRSEFFRDYFMEGFDMMIDQDYSIAVYPRLTFGNGQRYASKGCYIVRLPKVQTADVEQVSNWIIY